MSGARQTLIGVVAFLTTALSILAHAAAIGVGPFA